MTLNLENITIDRDDLIHIVEQSYDEINAQNEKDVLQRFIQLFFDKCGLNPWREDQLTFHKHLDELSEEGIYKSLLSKNNEGNTLGSGF